MVLLMRMLLVHSRGCRHDGQGRCRWTDDVDEGILSRSVGRLIAFHWSDRRTEVSDQGSR